MAAIVIQCINNTGAEDQLTIGRKYRAAPVIMWNTNYYRIVNDKNTIGNYDCSSFEDGFMLSKGEKI
jgi:hypothetical protein